MTGVASPLYPIVEPFGASAVDPDDITLPVPIDPTANPVEASFELGFPPITRTDPETGGQPPYGQDFNGILYMITAYCAMLQAGQCIPFSQESADFFGGYELGAVVKRTGGGFWYNTVDGNDTDPEGMAAAGWLGWNPTGTGSVAATLPGGTSTNYDAAGAFDASTRFLDLATSGAALVNGFIQGYDGQTVTVSNVGVDIIEVGALTGTAGHQVRLPDTLTLLPNMSFTMAYSTAAAGGDGLWIAN